MHTHEFAAAWLGDVEKVDKLSMSLDDLIEPGPHIFPENKLHLHRTFVEATCGPSADRRASKGGGASSWPF